MTLPTELERLAALHASGALTDDEFAAAKAALLEGGRDDRPGGVQVAAGRPDVDDVGAISRQQLAELRRANAVAELDREWEMERESFMMTGQHGDADGYGGHPYRYRPTRSGSVIGGIVVAVFGCFWTATAASMSSAASSFEMMDGGGGAMFGLFPLFGVLFVVFGLWMSYQSYTKADGYELAERDYKRRRAELLAGRDDPGPTASPAAGEDIDPAGRYDDYGAEGVDNDSGGAAAHDRTRPGNADRPATRSKRRDDGIFFG